MSNPIHVQFGTLIMALTPELAEKMTPPEPAGPTAEEETRGRIDRAVAVMRQRVRGKVRGRARAALLRVYEEALREAEGLGR